MTQLPERAGTEPVLPSEGAREGAGRGAEGRAQAWLTRRPLGDRTADNWVIWLALSW